MKIKCRRRLKLKRKRKHKHKRGESIIQYLPEDVLYQIFTHLDDLVLKSISLVCKLFRSLASPLFGKLYLNASSLPYSDFQKLFKRFHCVKRIEFYDKSVLDNALLAISKSDLNLQRLQLRMHTNPLFLFRPPYPERHTIESMSTSRVIKGIKSLELHWFDGHAPELHVIEFINMFPSLTELIITCGKQWKDRLIQKVTSKLPNLLNIGLNNSMFATDNILTILSTNCPQLESVSFRMCNFTAEALHKFFCNNPKLRSVYMPDFYYISSICKVVECVQVLKSLSHLSLHSHLLEDSVLILLAESLPPLKSLVIRFSVSYTMAGLSRLLYACPSLETLDIHLPYSVKRKNCKIHDREMSIVVQKLVKLKHVTVRSPIVCQATLFSLIENCPLLETIWLMSGSHPMKVYYDEDMARPSKKNYSIKSIKITSKYLDIRLWLMVQSYCPNLRT